MLTAGNYKSTGFTKSITQKQASCILKHITTGLEFCEVLKDGQALRSHIVTPCSEVYSEKCNTP